MCRRHFSIIHSKAISVAELMRRFDERVERMNDGTLANKIAKLRYMTGQVPSPPIAGESL